MRKKLVAGEHNEDIRPLIRRYLEYGYINKKAKQFRLERQTISNILGGKVDNAQVYDECLNELKEKMALRAAQLKRVYELSEVHKQLQR